MTNQRVERDNYDPHIVPAETAARREREGENFKHKLDSKQADQESDFDTTGGYTVDQEGLANNFAIEPEMYYEEPGDRREKEAQEEADRVEELQEINHPGGKGPGLV